MKILSKIACIMILTLIVCMPTDGLASWADIGYITSSYIGNIYTRDELPHFRIELENTEDVAKQLTASCVVTDLETGLFVWDSGTITDTVPEKTMFVKGIQPNLEGKFGNFKMETILTFDGKTDTHVMNFTIVQSNEHLADNMGFSCHFSDLDDFNNGGTEIMKKSGSAWVRDEIKWEVVEKEKGVYEIPEYYENFVNAFCENANKMLLILCYGNELYESWDSDVENRYVLPMPVTEEGIQAYAKYCAFMAEHFKGRVDTFEIWNEPETETFGGGKERTAEEYSKLVKAAYTAIKSANADATVIAGVTAPLSGSGSRKFLGEFLNIDNIENYMDAVSVHPYGGDDYYADEDDFNYFRTFESQISLVKGYMTSNNISKPIWVTEVGDSSYGVHSEKEQATELIRTSIIAKSDPAIEKVFIYNLIETGTEPDDRESNFGVVNRDMSVKRGYIAVANMNNILKDAEFINKYIENKNHTRYHFVDKKNGKDIYVLWANKRYNGKATLRFEKSNTAADAAVSSENGVVTFSVPKEYETKVVDVNGNILEKSDRYTLSEEPLYVILPLRMHEPDIRFEDKHVTVSGVDSEVGSYITILAVNEIAMGKPIQYIDQAVVDKNGKYNFEFDAGENEFYSIYIFGGRNKITKYNENSAYKTYISYLVNGKRCENVSQIKAGDTLKITLNMEKKKKDNPNLTFYAGVYGNENILAKLNTSDIKWNEDNTAEASVEFVLESEKQANNIRCFLWNERLMPIMPTINLKN